jgi:hypothetical protein
MLESEMLRLGTQRAPYVNESLLHTLLKRRKTYCDITQGYSEAQLVEALLKTGNDVRLALLALKATRGNHRVCIPPSYLVAASDVSPKIATETLQPRSFFLPIVRCCSSSDLLTSKGFFDREPSMKNTQAHRMLTN